MMKSLKKVLMVTFTAVLLLQLTALPTAFAAETGSDGDFDWVSLSDEAVSVTLYTGAGGAVIIPQTLSGRAVTQISEAAFQGSGNKTTVTSVSIPSSVTTIESGAFHGCTSLKTVTFEDGSQLGAISDELFRGTALTSIKIPAAVDSIGDYAFYGCASLSGLTIETGDLTDIGDYAFSGTAFASMKIPASVENIGDSAFADCGKLALLTFASDSQLDTIGEDAFSGAKITNVTIPESVSTIETGAFADCGSLTRAIFLGDTVDIQGDVFEDSNLNSLDGGGIYGNIGSTSETYANTYHWPFHTIDLAVGKTTIISAISSGSDRATITWTAADRATGYEVLRATSSGGTYSVIASVSGTSYTNINLTINTAYYYKVRGYCLNGLERVYGETSDYASVTPLPYAPTSVYAEATGYNSIRLTWSDVTGAAGYKIYRAYSENGTYSLVKTTTNPVITTTALMPADYTKPSKKDGEGGTMTEAAGDISGPVTMVAVRRTYTFTGLTTGKTYYYKIRAYQKSGTTTVYGNYSAVTSATPTLSGVTGLKVAVATPLSLKLTWTAVSGRTGYEVWRSDAPPEEKALTYYGRTSYTYYTNDRYIQLDHKYYYMVRAYRTVSGVKQYGPFSEVVSETPTIKQVTGVKAERYSSTKIKISWSSLSGVSGYKILYSTSESGEYISIGTTTSTYFIHTGLTTGVPCYYKVIAYKVIDSIPNYGKIDSVVVTATP